MIEELAQVKEGVIDKPDGVVVEYLGHREFSAEVTFTVPGEEGHETT